MPLEDAVEETHSDSGLSVETSEGYKTERNEIIEEAKQLIKYTAENNIKLIDRILKLVNTTNKTKGGNLNKSGGGKTKRQRRKRNRRKSSKAFTQ